MRPAYNHTDEIVGRCQYCDVAQYDETATDCWKCGEPWKDDDTEDTGDDAGTNTEKKESE